MLDPWKPSGIKLYGMISCRYGDIILLLSSFSKEDGV